jgi:hypothetical protein
VPGRSVAREFANSAVFFVLAVLVALGGMRLGLGTLAEPGPGVYPVVLGVALGALAAWLAVSTLVRPPQAPPPDTGRSGQLAMTITTLALYILLLPVAGSAVTTVAFLAALFRIGGMAQWSRIVALSLAFGLGAHFTCNFIGIALPTGALWEALLARGR